MHSSIDGTDMKFPWLMKKIFGLFMSKEKILNEKLSPGFKIPNKGQAQFSPDPNTSTEEGLNAGCWAIGLAISGNEVGVQLDQWNAFPEDLKQKAPRPHLPRYVPARSTLCSGQRRGFDCHA